MAAIPPSEWLTPTLDDENLVSRRSGQAACLGGDGFIYCFGGISNEEGDGETEFFDDLRRLHLDAENVATWETVEATGDIPQAREGHGLLSVNRKLFLIGGVTAEEDEKFTEGVYTFCIDTNVWKLVEVSGESPLGTTPTYCSAGEKLIVFGGIYDGVPLNSVHMLDTVGLKWTVLDCAGPPPPPRCDHAACIANDSMYIYGGSGGEDLNFDDVHRLDLSTLTWSEVELSGSMPTARDYASLVPYGNKGIVLHGGSRMDRAVSGTYYLAVKGKEWLLLKPKGTKPPSRFSHAVVMNETKMILISGMTASDDGTEELSDISILSFPELELEKENVSFVPTELPPNHFDNPPQPAKRRPNPAPKVIVARDFEDYKTTSLRNISEGFDFMIGSYLKLDQDKEAHRVERAVLEEDRKQLEKMQEDHRDLFEKQRRFNEEWLEARRTENDAERQALANEKDRLARERAQLEQERKAFDEKNKQFKAIMSAVKDIN